MHFTTDHAQRISALTALFETAFTASEGPEEGRMIAKLAQGLMTTTSAADLLVCLASKDADAESETDSERDSGAEIGAIIFSRLTYENDPRAVFVLGPVAVAPHHQRKGVGLALLRFGLAALREAGADVALTYGDPGYYGRAGFAPITQDAVAAPYPLQFPEGWLGQSLTASPLGTLKGPVRCVPAFADPAFW